ncbi:E3 ubiquitin-protein ligase RNF213-like [Glandiceps talaboti]
MVYNTSEENEFEVVTSAISGAAQEIYDNVLSRHAEATRISSQSPPVIHLAYNRVQSRIESLRNIIKILPKVVQKLRTINASHEMISDITAMQMLLETLIPRNETFADHSLRKRWLTSIQASAPIINRILSLVEKRGEEAQVYGEKSLKLVDTTRCMWTRIRVMQFFVEQVCIPESELTDLNVEHCIRLQKVLEGCKDINFKELHSLGIIENLANEFINNVSPHFGRFDIRECPVCLEALRTPTPLPCDHILCTTCLQDVMATTECDCPDDYCTPFPLATLGSFVTYRGSEEEERCTKCDNVIGEGVKLPCEHDMCKECAQEFITITKCICPTCRHPFSATLKPTVSLEMLEAVEQLSTRRKWYNAFFMEIISRECFGGSKPPDDDVCERLIGYVTRKVDTNAKTKNLTPFTEDCVDPTPVLRSFLLQLLLRFSKSHDVKEHLSDYLNDALQHSSGSVRDTVELCMLFTQCIEDSLYQEALESNENVREGIIEVATKKLKSGIRPKSVRPTAIDVSRLELIASARFSLTLTAELLYLYHCGSKKHTEAQQKNSHSEYQKATELFKVAKRYCVEVGADYARLFLVKQLFRRFGRDSALQITRQRKFDWVLPEVHQMNEDVPDRLLSCGPLYSQFRYAVSKAVVHEVFSDIEDLLQSNILSGNQLQATLLLGLYRAIVIVGADAERNPVTKEQISDVLKDFLEGCSTITFKDLGKSIIDGVIERPCKPGLELTLDEVVVHTEIVLNCAEENKVLKTLATFANEPQTTKGAFFPTMPEDSIMDVKMALRRVESLTWYECVNGHPYTIGECGRPRMLWKCADCGVAIGGVNYAFADKKGTAARNEDTSQTGHILGDPLKRKRTAETERNMSPLATAIVRIICHAALAIAANKVPNKMTDVFNIDLSNYEGITNVLTHHMECDLQQIAAALGKSVDDAVIVVHLVLHGILDRKNVGTGNFDPLLAEKADRVQWEDEFVKEYINPIVKVLKDKLGQANKAIHEDRNLANNTLEKLIYEIDIDENLSPGILKELHKIPAMWRYRSRITVAHLTQFLLENMTSDEKKDEYKVLNHFLAEEYRLRALQYLPHVVRLQQRLIDRFHRNIDEAEAIDLTIDMFLGKLQGQEKEEFELLIDAFKRAWKIVRREIAKSGRLPVSKELCMHDIDEDFHLAILLPTRKGEGLVSTALLDFLIMTHNEFMHRYLSITGQENTSDEVNPEDASVAHLVAYDTDKDLLPILIANCNYTLQVHKGQELQAEYDLVSLQKQLEERFIHGRPYLQLTIQRLAFRQDAKDYATFESLKCKIHQEPLSKVLQRDVLTSMESLPDIRDSLACLDISISLLSSSGGDPTLPISAYLINILKIDTELVKLKDQRCQLKHVISLWQLLSVERARRLTLNGQDPLDTLSDMFRESLGNQLSEKLRHSLRNLDVEHLLSELHEYIALDLKKKGVQEGNFQDKEDALMIQGWSIRDTLYAYIDVKDGEEIRGLMENFPEEVECRHAWETWNLVVKFHANVTAAK